MKSRTAKFAGKSVTLYMYDMEGEKNPNLLVQVRMASFLKKKKMHNSKNPKANSGTSTREGQQ